MLALFIGCTTPRAPSIDAAIGPTPTNHLALPENNPAAVEVHQQAQHLTRVIAMGMTDQCATRRAQFVEFHAYEHIRAHRARAALETWRARRFECKSWDELDSLWRHSYQIARARQGDETLKEAIAALDEIHACRDAIIAHHEHRYCADVDLDVYSIIQGFGRQVVREQPRFDWSVSNLECPKSVTLTVETWPFEELRLHTASVALDLEKKGVSRLTIQNATRSMTIKLKPAPRVELMDAWAIGFGYTRVVIPTNDPPCLRPSSALRPSSRPIPPDVAARIMVDVLSALEHAHNAVNRDGQPLGIVHRDVTPSIVLVSNDGIVILESNPNAETFIESANLMAAALTHGIL